MLTQQFVVLWANIFIAPQAGPVGILPVRRHSSSKKGQQPHVASIPADGSVWPAAVYWTFIDVGTPPRRFPVCIDSGSPFLVISGKGCEGCTSKAPNNGYDPALSLSSMPSLNVLNMPNQPGFIETPPDGSLGGTAHFRYMYKTCDLLDPNAPCSIEGPSYREKVSIAGFGPVDMVVGSIMNQSKNIDQFDFVNGIMGILPPWKGYTQRNLFARLVEAGLCEPIWSLCLHEGSVGTGTLTIGGVDERLVDGPITYVNNTAKFPVGPPLGTIWMYGVHVSHLKVGSTTIEVGYTATLDSGTNILLLPTELHHQVQHSMCADTSLAHCADLWNNTCVHLTQKEIDAYPAFNIELDGITLEMTSADYLLLGSPVAASAKQHCIGIRDGGPSHIGGFLIGDTTMRNYYLVHDVGRELIGWGKVNRDTCGSLDSSQAEVHSQALRKPIEERPLVTSVASLPWISMNWCLFLGASPFAFCFYLRLSMQKRRLSINDEVVDGYINLQ